MLGASGTRSLADLRGKVVVLNFWASWCKPCKAEAPVLAAAQERLQRDGTGTVLGVTYDDSTPDSLKFVKDYGVRYPNLRDVGTKLAEQYGTTSLPETFVIDAQGRIADFYRGQIDEARLDRALAKAHGMRRAALLVRRRAARRARPRRSRSQPAPALAARPRSSTSRTRSCARPATSR